MSRPATSPATTAPRQALVRDMTAGGTAGSTEPEVVLDARPAIDFLVSLMLDTEPELLATDRAWLDESRGSLSATLKRDLARVCGSEQTGKGVGCAIFPLVVEATETRTAADVVALASRTAAGDLLRAFCDSDEMRPTLDLASRVLAGEETIRDEALAACPEVARAGIGRLLDDPAGEVRALRRILRAWAERFRTIEARIAAMEQRDVESRRADLERLPLVEVVERLTGGVRWVPDPGTRRLVLSPSYFARPYNYVFGGRDWHMFAYPLAEAALGERGDAVPAASLRLFKALGDESRLRILRLLGAGDLYLTEIAERTSLSKPTISHHLALLRAAGLVTITEAGALTYYSLRRDRVLEVGIELAAYLGDPTQ